MLVPTLVVYHLICIAKAVILPRMLAAWKDTHPPVHVLRAPSARPRPPLFATLLTYETNTRTKQVVFSKALQFSLHRGPVLGHPALRVSRHG